jgi:hypothetical protein
MLLPKSFPTLLEMIISGTNLNHQKKMSLIKIVKILHQISEIKNYKINLKAKI